MPANMNKEKPFVWLKQNGKYYVELGQTAVGLLIRIDNFLDKLDSHLETLTQGLSNLESRQIGLTKELENKESYARKIEECKQRLNEIDKELGVDKK